MNLMRKKNNKWIFQKNISSKDMIEAYVYALKENKNKIDYDKTLKLLKSKNFYKGRNNFGKKSTMSVRMSQMCFYMIGYNTKTKEFIPSVSTQMFEKSEEKEKIFLLNLFSLQFPNPYSKTPINFNIHVGRLLIKLLLDEKINKKLYIDEFIWFLPFIETIDQKKYDELINEILLYRKKSYYEKLELFHSINDYDSLFANILHESLYYFIRIFESFGVFKTVEDSKHNSGNLFNFKHGKNTKRKDSIKSNGKYPGYIEINKKLLNFSSILLKNHPFYEKPISQKESLNREDWIKDLYEFKMLEYYHDINNYDKNISNLKEIIKDMVHQSKYGTNDGKSFENSLRRCFELFREVINVESIGGSGDTDLLCNILKHKSLFKINVDAKKRENALLSINPARIKRHQEKNGSEYTIIVSPRFSKGSIEDIQNYKIVTISADTLANYCLKECLNSGDGKANFDIINDIIVNNYGKDVSESIENLMTDMYKL